MFGALNLLLSLFSWSEMQIKEDRVEIECERGRGNKYLPFWVEKPIAKGEMILWGGDTPICSLGGLNTILKSVHVVRLVAFFLIVSRWCNWGWRERERQQQESKTRANTISCFFFFQWLPHAIKMLPVLGSILLFPLGLSERERGIHVSSSFFSLSLSRKCTDSEKRILLFKVRFGLGLVDVDGWRSIVFSFQWGNIGAISCLWSN